MRVAYISAAPVVFGAERSLQTMLLHVASEGIRPLVICQPGSPFKAWCVDHGIPIAETPLAWRDRWHPLRWWNSTRRIRHILREQRIDVVHSNQIYSYPASGAAAGEFRLPRVCHMRNVVSPASVQWWCWPRPEAVVCISRYIEAQVRNAWPSPNRPLIHTILNPVILPKLASTVEGRRAARQRFKVPGQAILFGFIGQLAPVKGVLELLDALMSLKDDSRWHLLVAGSDPYSGAVYERACLEKVNAGGFTSRVTFAGFLDSVEDFYRAVDLVVVPSLEEPLGRVPLEAAAYARPSVAFATGGLPETIVHGESGWLVPTGDVRGLRDHLARFLDRPQPQMGVRARHLVERRCDPRLYAREMRALYARLMEPMSKAA